jgi:hypothetical protein
MPAFHSIDTDLLNALRSGGFAGELRFAVNPATVVFQATVNQTITDSAFVSFAWDTVLQGSYGDVVAGMTFYITATTDPLELRRPLLQSRVSQIPTSSTFYCNQAAINLSDGMIITVIANFEVVQKDRVINLVDGYLAFQKQSPLVKNMQSFYYGEDDTGFEFSFAPIGQAMEEGTTIASYTYTIDGVTHSTQNLTITIPYGHHWCFLDIADTNGTPFRFIFEVLVCLRDDDTYMFRAHNDVHIDGGVDNGWNVTTTFFAGVEGLLNRTRCAIVAFDVPRSGDGSLWPNVMFVGYIVQEETQLTGDPASAILSETRFELQSFGDLAAQIPVPSLAIEDEAVPTSWEKMPKPTIQRAIAHIMTRYSTLASLCAIDVLYTDSTWLSDDIDLEASTLLETVNRLGERIQAKLVFFPGGDACYEINGNFLSPDERNDLPTLLASASLGTRDLFAYSLPIPYYKTVGQVIAGCATFYTDGRTPVLLKAIAPATAKQEGPESPVIPNQLLQANLSAVDAVTAAEQRIGDLLEYLNPAVQLPSTYKDGWRLLTPSTRVWLTYDVPGTDSTRGLAVDASTRWLLLSLSLTWSVQAGTWDVQGTVREETRGGTAQRGATISPNVVDTSRPILPGLSDYGAFAPDGSLNYTSANPDDADLQPYGPSDLAQYTPMTTEDAATEADNTPSPTCSIISPPVNFSSPVTRFTPHATVNGATYTVTVSGHAQVSTTGGTETFDFRTGEHGWAILYPGVDYAIYHAGEGYGPNIGTYRIGVFFAFPGLTSQVDLYFSEAQPFALVIYTTLAAGYVSQAASASGPVMVDGLYKYTYTTAPFADGVAPTVIDFGSSISPTQRLVKAAVTTDSDPITTYADPFYIWNVDPDTGQEINVELNPNGGLLLNGTPISVPPEYNSNHEYTFTYVGDGNVTPFTFYDTDYADNQSKVLYIRVCGLGMGS